MKVLTFGELLLRLNAPGQEKLFQSDVFKCSFCGAEANVAVSLANFGIDTKFVSKLPNNDVGKAASKVLNSFGIDTSSIIYGDGRMGLYYFEKGASQRPSKVIYDRCYSTIAEATVDDFNWDLLFEGVDWFHFSGINPALSNSLFEITLRACVSAKKRGVTISCDLNYRSKLWSSDEAQKAMKTLLKYVDVCIGNEEDAYKALGVGAGNNTEYAKLNACYYESIAKTIKEKYGCRYVAFTLRESFSADLNGWSSVLYDGERLYHSKRYEIQLVDRVGGGDSFSAGLIFGLLTKMTNQDAVDFATAASCLKQTIEGDFNLSSTEDVYKLMKGNGNGRVQR